MSLLNVRSTLYLLSLCVYMRSYSSPLRFIIARPTAILCSGTLVLLRSDPTALSTQRFHTALSIALPMMLPHHSAPHVVFLQRSPTAPSSLSRGATHRHFPIALAYRTTADTQTHKHHHAFPERFITALSNSAFPQRSPTALPHITVL